MPCVTCLDTRSAASVRLVLPAPMLSRSGAIPSGEGWTFEVKWDGFRALVSTVDGVRVRSRRGWNMTELLPELRSLPAGLVLDGELVAFKNGVPHFPLLSRRLLNGDRSIPVSFVAFDLLHVDGRDLMRSPHRVRREALESLALHDGFRIAPETFSDGHELYTAVCEQGLEGIVAKRSSSPYRQGNGAGIQAMLGLDRTTSYPANSVACCHSRRRAFLSSGGVATRVVSRPARTRLLRPWTRVR